MNAKLKRQRRRLLTRPDALRRGLKRYRGKVCAKHRSLKGERMMHGSCVGCVRDLKRSPKYLARQRAYKRSPEYLARQRARQTTPEFRARRNARNLARRIKNPNVPAVKREAEEDGGVKSL
jgi:hypothetical protein